eukprot:12877530-Heterocapsa_arctica.AAC.1
MDSHHVGRARPYGFLCKSGEKEREQETERSSTLNHNCYYNYVSDDFICRIFGSNLGVFEGPNTKLGDGGGRTGR